jgi:hypothetical protein
MVMASCPEIRIMYVAPEGVASATMASLFAFYSVLTARY